MNKITLDSESQKRSAKESISSSSEIISVFVQALAKEVEAIRKASGETSISLHNGKCIESTTSSCIYRFEYQSDVYLQDDMPITVTIGEQEASGIVVSLVDKVIVIIVEQDFGDVITHAEIKFDSSFLVDRLRQRYEEIGKGESAQLINTDMFGKVLGIKASRTGRNRNIAFFIQDLNREQKRFVYMALGSELTMLWGPQGTGKTHALARVVEAFYNLGKKILVVSNTNIAVDTLLEKLCERLCNDKLFQRGGVLRYGILAKKELKEHFKEYVSVDAVTARLSENLINEKESLNLELSKLNKEVEPLERIIKMFDTLDQITNKQNKVEPVIKRDQSRVRSSKNELLRFDQLEKRLKTDLHKAQSSGRIKKLLLKLNEKEIQNSLDLIPSRRQGLINVIETLEAEILNKKKGKEILGRQATNLKRLLENKDKVRIKKSLEIAKTNTQPIKQRLTEVEAALNKVREEVNDNCRVHAATATQAYLKPKDFRSFDVVIVDEASMLTLPATVYVAALATENMVVAGDFRQLDPNIQSKDEDVIKWVGTDIFYQCGVVEAIESNALPKNLVMLKAHWDH